jgi:multidrug efflux pump subunit AcrA (membrane-fusion protein)
MEKKSTVRKGLFVMAIILVGAGFLFIPSIISRGGNTTNAIPRRAPVFSVRTTNAEIQTLNAYLDVNGDIVSTQQADVFPDVAGRLVSMRVALGTYVQRGQLIAEIDPSRPGTTFMNSPVYAPISGFVSRTPLSVGMTVNTNTSITTISANGTFEISARIPEREIAGLVPGLKAEVSLQAYPGETFSATVTRVSPIIDSASRTKLIYLSFDQNDTRIRAGMFARITINTRSYTNIIVVPSEAVISSRGMNIVYVIERNNAGQPIAVGREVSRGVSLQGWTEIRSGLDEGETVIVQGQQILSGGEAVRIIGGSIAQSDSAQGNIPSRGGVSSEGGLR